MATPSADATVDDAPTVAEAGTVRSWGVCVYNVETATVEWAAPAGEKSLPTVARQAYDWMLRQAGDDLRVVTVEPPLNVSQPDGSASSQEKARGR